MQLQQNAQSYVQQKRPPWQDAVPVMIIMMKFHPEALCEEWTERAPLFFSILMSSALSGRRKDVKTVTWLPSVALAGSVLLRERSRGMDAMQLLVSTIIKSSGSQVDTCFCCCCCCLGSVRVKYSKHPHVRT